MRYIGALVLSVALAAITAPAADFYERDDMPTVAGITESAVTSTALISWGYSLKRGERTVTIQATFQSGDAYQYFSVPLSVLKGLQLSTAYGGTAGARLPTVGEYFYHNVRNGGFPYKLIRDVPPLRQSSLANVPGSVVPPGVATPSLRP